MATVSNQRGPTAVDGSQLMLHRWHDDACFEVRDSRVQHPRVFLVRHSAVPLQSCLSRFLHVDLPPLSLLLSPYKDLVVSHIIPGLLCGSLQSMTASRKHDARINPDVFRRHNITHVLSLGERPPLQDLPVQSLHIAVEVCLLSCVFVGAGLRYIGGRGVGVPEKPDIMGGAWGELDPPPSFLLKLRRGRFQGI